MHDLDLVIVALLNLFGQDTKGIIVACRVILRISCNRI